MIIFCYFIADVLLGHCSFATDASRRVAQRSDATLVHSKHE